MLPKRIIHIIDNIEQKNFGLWNAAIATAPHFHERNISSELWFPKPKDRPNADSLNYVGLVELAGTTYKDLESAIKERKLDRSKDIIITHGTWQYPTKWGRKLKGLGFHWIYTPHGMLEPIDRQRKWIKKLIYFQLFEKRWASKADTVRAVSLPEKDNLSKHFSHVAHIPNGIDEISAPIISKSLSPIIFLFMARLHAKKGINELLLAWRNSVLFINADYKLIIAGPDDGEKARVEALIKEAGINSNIEYIGPIYGAEKVKLLSKSSYYILPSHSEGFPTSVLEAMQFKNVCLITEGCNFPEAFTSGVAIKISPNIEELTVSLNHMKVWSKIERDKLGENAEAFVTRNYSLKQIAMKQLDLFSKCK